MRVLQSPPRLIGVVSGLLWFTPIAVVIASGAPLARPEQTAAVQSLSPEASVDVSGNQQDVAQFFRKALDTSDFTARWQSAAWSPSLAWLHIAADGAICLAWLLIPFVVMQSIQRRPRAPYARLFWLFGPAFVACGLTHLFEAVMFWWPAYRLLGLIKAGTASVSLIAAAALIPIAPKVLGLRSPAELQLEIAQRRRTELELRQVHAQLEGVIELRTAELASKNEEMEQFLNTVSHDLKSPVVTCLGLAGMLREDVGAGRLEETKDTINRIERAATRMKQLIDDLLNLSRIGKVRFELADVDTLAMIRSIGDELRPRLEQAGAILHIEDNLPRLRADTRWLTEVFENLINNAIKYGCDNPGPAINIGSITGEKEHRIYVRDNGKGIDPAHHPHLFEPFRRFRTDKEGSGMGLAIVMRIIKMHGGRVWIESKPGAGATFWVALPAVADAKINNRVQTAHA